MQGELEPTLGFLPFALNHCIPPPPGRGLGKVVASVDQACAAAMAKLPPPKPTRGLPDAVAKHPCPIVGLHRPKMRYAHQGGSNPPIIVIHGNALDSVPEHYKRYLEKTFRELFKLQGTPLRVQFKQGSNPYADRKAAPITKREENKARRERRFRKKKYG